MTVSAKVIQTIAGTLNWEAAEIHPTTTLEFLGADSLDRAEIALSLEDEFHITISDEETFETDTVDEIVKMVEAKMGRVQ